MKKLIFVFVAVLLINLSSKAQQNPTGVSSVNNPGWTRGGNGPVNAVNRDNILATMFNSPIYFGTGGNLATNTGSGIKMKLNGLFNTTTVPQYVINGYTTGIFPGSATTTNTTGYLLLSTNNNSSIYTSKGAFSQLHLNGSGTFVQEFGYRPWMKTGVTLTSNNDLMYIGQKSNGLDITDAIISWSDNPTGFSGPDVMKFVFSQGSNSAIVNPRDPNGFNGYEFMRMQASTAVTNSTGASVGHVGIGPLFTNASGPQSRLHLNAEDALPTYLQVTSETATGQAATDGMRVGIDNVGNAQIINQETHIPIQFWLNATPFGGGGVTAERIRMTAQPYQVSLFAAGANARSSNLTRMGIYRSGSPGQNPVSMLQVGEPWPAVTAANGIGVGGLRDWMDVGTYYNQTTDNMYVGLRSYVNGAGNLMDVADAIINWGNNPTLIQNNPNAIGDKLRFVFTGATGNAQASTYEGIEIGRMVVNGNFAPVGSILGRMGIGGDPAVNAYSAGSVNIGNNANTLSSDPQNTMEINSPAPTAVPALAANTSNGFNFPNGHTPVPPANTPSTGFSGLRFTDLTSNSIPELNPGANVLTVDANGDVILVPEGGGGGGAAGLLCANPGSVLPVGPGNDARIGLNGNNFYFEGQGAVANSVNSVGVGIPCGNPLGAKLDVLSTNRPIAGQFIIPIGQAPNIFGGGIGVFSLVIGNGQNSTAGYFRATGTAQNIAVWGHATGTATGAPYPTTSLAGLFEGDVWASGSTIGTGFVYPSDIALKKDTSSFVEGLDVIRNIHPITFRYNGKAGLDSTKQHTGVVAEQLAEIAPYAIDTLFAKLDSSDVEPTTLLGIKEEAILYTSINAIKQLDSAVTALQNNPGGISGSGTANYLAKWDNANSITNSQIFDNGTNVGIGTVSPTSTLDIVSTTAATGLSVRGGAAAFSPLAYFANNTAQGGVVTIQGGADNGQPALSVIGNGYNGIHATSINSRTAVLGTAGPGTGVAGTATGAAGIGVEGSFQASGGTCVKARLLEGNGKGLFVNLETDKADNQAIVSDFNAGNQAETGTKDLNVFRRVSHNGFGYTGNLVLIDDAGTAALNSGNILNVKKNGNTALIVTADENTGIGTPSPTEKLYVNGNIFATGSITQNSDAALKENQAAISNALDIVDQLNPKTFNFKTAQFPQLDLPQGNQYGLIAQEVETILPELITSSFYPEVKDSLGNTLYPRVDYKGLNYTALIPILIKAVQEQHAKINALESEMSACCSAVSKLPNQRIGGLPSSSADLASQTPILYQNMPNPFGEGTAIRYFIPENQGGAIMEFFDEYGNKIKTLELPYSGQVAELNLSTLNLAAGVYSYSMIVNGKVIDTKRMLKTK